MRFRPVELVNHLIKALPEGELSLDNVYATLAPILGRLSRCEEVEKELGLRDIHRKTGVSLEALTAQLKRADSAWGCYREASSEFDRLQAKYGGVWSVTFSKFELFPTETKYTSPVLSMAEYLSRGMGDWLHRLGLTTEVAEDTVTVTSSLGYPDPPVDQAEVDKVCDATW